jgi:dTDP-4-amino-4,6-dideoxygalactose transaminase
MKILSNSLNFKLNKYKNKIKKKFSEIYKFKIFIKGKNVKEFEKRLAKLLRAKYAISCGNGTDAIRIGLSALGIKKNDLVATAANAGGYSTIAIKSLGARPVYYDTIENHPNTSLELIKKIKKKIKAIIITHLYGVACQDIELIAKFCKKQNIFMIEDCAQSIGVKLKNKYLGTFGDISTTSFYPTKNLGALGDGGAIITNTKKYYINSIKLREYGWNKKYFSQLDNGQNSRLDEIQAGFLNIFISGLLKENEKRLKIAKIFNDEINNKKIKKINFNFKTYNAHIYAILSQNRNLLKKYLKEKGVHTEIHYPIGDNKQIINKNKNIKLFNTDRFVNKVLTIPCYIGLKKKEIKKIIKLINNF